MGFLIGFVAGISAFLFLLWILGIDILEQMEEKFDDGEGW